MPDRNRWEGLTNGLIKGLYGLGSGMIEHSERKDAKGLFNSLTSDYAKISTLKNNAIDVVNKEGANLTDTRANNIDNPDNPQELPMIDKTPVDNKLLISKLYEQIANKSGELGNNPYGKSYLDVINKLYGKSDKKYNTYFDKTNNLMIVTDEYGNIVKKERYLQEKQKELSKKYTQEEIDKMTLADVEKMNTDDIDKIFSFLPITVQNEWNAKHTEPNEIPKFKGTGPRGYRGSSTTKETTTTQEKMMDANLRAYQKAVNENDTENIKKYGGIISSKGLDPNEELNKYQYLDNNPKKRNEYLTETVRTTQQINDAYNQYYDEIGMSKWWDDFGASANTSDYEGKKQYYNDYLERELKPQLDPKVYNKLKAEYDKAVKNIYNEKRIWERD